MLYTEIDIDVEKPTIHQQQPAKQKENMIKIVLSESNTSSDDSDAEFDVTNCVRKDTVKPYDNKYLNNLSLLGIDGEMP